MPNGSVAELQTVASLQESLLARQRALKSKTSQLEPLNVSAHVSALLDALSAITRAEGLDSLDRLEKQTQVLTALALLFALVRLEEVLAAEEYSLQTLEAAWSLWPAAGAGLGTLRCRELTRNLIRLPVAGQSCIKRLLDFCKEAPLGTKRVLACLQELLDAGEHDCVEAAFPDLLQRCLGLLQQTDISTAAGRLCVSLISARLPPQSNDFDAFVPLLKHALCQDSGTERALAASHLLPLLVKSRPKLFQALYAEVVATGEILDVFLALARSGFAAGLIRREELPDNLLQAAMRHRDSKLRASVIVLLSDAPSTALRFSSVDFDLLRAFFKYDMGPTDGDFRQSTSAAWMRILIRIRTSVYGADRNAKSAAKKGAHDEAAEGYIESVKSFLEEVLQRLRRALLSCSPYRIQSGALRHLTTLLASGIDSAYQGELDKAAQKSVAQFLTQPGAGPLWPFETQVCNDSLTRTLLRCLLSTYDDVREGAFALLLDMPKIFAEVDTLLRSAMALLRDRRESETASGALMAELAARLGAESVMDQILQAAEEDVTLAEQDLSKAAQTNPMHGCLVGARRLYVAQLDTLYDTALHTRVLRLCERVWAVVEPVLCHASPEGMEMNGLTNGLADHEDARALHVLQNANDDDDDLDDEGSVGPRHKVLLSAAWRSAKESAALLETCLVQSVAARQLEKTWDSAAVQRVGQLFATWLLQIRHRGAFSAIYPSYGRMCRALIEYKAWSQASSIPLKLLEGHLESVRSGHTSTTRRSAGLPYCILGALTGIKAAAPEVVANTLKELLRNAGGSDRGESSLVHAMNALRILVGDAELAPALTLFIEPCFALALQSFDSSSWNVRNVAMLLYASLVQRVLGARTTTLSTELQNGSKRTFSHDFFCRFPGLHPLLLRELERSSQKALQDVQTLEMHSALHAVLLLLGLLSTPTRSAVSDDMCLAFVPALQRCAASRVWRVRDAAAQALAGLLSPENVVERLQRMPVAAVLASDLTNNELHGQLLQILVPLQRSQLPYVFFADWSRDFDATASHLLKKARPPAVQAAVFSIVDTLGRLNGAPKLSFFAPSICHAAWEALGGETFSSEAAAMALLDQSDAAIKALLHSHSDAAIHFGLQALVKQPSTSVSVKQLQAHSQGSHDPRNRLLALKALSQHDCGTVLSDFEVLRAQYMESTALSVKLSLLPMMAGSVQTHDQASSLLQLVSAMCEEDADEEARQAGVKALLALPQAWKGSSAFQTLRLRVLQDDDPAIREQAELLSDSYAYVHALRQVEDCVHHIVSSQGADEALSSFVLKDVRASNHQVTQALFARERANIFKDDAFELEGFVATACSQQVTAWPLTRQALDGALPKLKELQRDCDEGESPFGLGCKPAFGLLTLQVSAAVQLAGSGANSEMHELIKRMTSATGL